VSAPWSAGEVCPLDDLGLLRFSGPDAYPFLQGQLSNDVTALGVGRLLRAGLHTPQGRTLALLALAPGASKQDIFAILPRELVASVAATLVRYVLRAKVKISDESSRHRIYGIGEASGEASAAPAAATGPTLHGYAPGRALKIAAAAESAAPDAPLARARWRALDIAAGVPQVYLATSGQFVAQMLNLDCIEAISFAKGCYTGQEVIARAHYRGKVKRRMQRFISSAPLRLAPGDSGQLSDGRSFRVVDAVTGGDGRCEFLAVAALASGEEAPGARSGPSNEASTVTIAAEALPLPYALPE
jgi:tRNA-modifying protein YgfZ